MILPDIIDVGIYNSRVIVKNTKISKERNVSAFELDLPIENGGISYINGNAKQIKPGMMICAKPGQVRHTRFPFTCYYVHMNVQDETLYHTLMKIPDFFETDKIDVYREIFEKLVKHHSSADESKEIILQSLLLELIYTISKDLSANNKNGNLTGNYLTVQKSLLYINEHLTEDLSLDKIAKQISFSPVYFHNTFKAITGKTLRDYVEEQRIKKATDLLLTTDRTLTQIAYECGFSSQSYFSYVFKRRMHATPREYAKRFHSRYEI